MKHVNLLSIIEAYHGLDSSLFGKLLQSYGITRAMKDYELESLEKMLVSLMSVDFNVPIARGFYISYSIPQIGKEFDLLRFGDNYIINIEIKTTSTPEKILKQQRKNKYYLSFLDKELYIYTYVADTGKLYKFISNPTNDSFIEVSFKELHRLLKCQTVNTPQDIDGLFNPSNYLVSPFNSTEKFISGAYFLTEQQELFNNNIESQLADKKTNFIALTGNAGTGKTLLTYHIAGNAMKNGKKVLILHCAPLNSGHTTLNDDYGWNIHLPRYAPDYNGFDLIIVDEAQRMYPNQFLLLVKAIKGTDKKCIFSYDENQYLRDNEKSYNIQERIKTDLKCKPYVLTDKIRTNKEIASFIRQLFDRNKNIPEARYPNIELSYCKNETSAKKLLQTLCNEGWHAPNYTPGTITCFQYESYKTGLRESAHSVVGQEFDKVAVTIDHNFKYDQSGKLNSVNEYYSQRQMLYQIITRTRKQLHIIIINNPELLDRCLAILD